MRLRVARKVYKAWTYRHRKGTVFEAIRKLTTERIWRRARSKDLVIAALGLRERDR